MTREEYIADPCFQSALPLWKLARYPVPDGMLVVHDREFSPELMCGYSDTPYFRLKHGLENIPEKELTGGLIIRSITPGDFPALISQISRAYKDVAFTVDTVAALMRSPVYDPALWLAAFDGDIMAGSIIAELDPEVPEAAVEWLQTAGEYRGRGIAAALLCECLLRMKGRALFATVSGKRDDPLRPEGVYRRCGFTGSDVWHILTKERNL